MKSVLVKYVHGVDWLAEGEIFDWCPDTYLIIDAGGTEVDYDEFNKWDIHHWTITDDKVLTLFGLECGSRAVLEVIE